MLAGSFAYAMQGNTWLALALLVLLLAYTGTLQKVNRLEQELAAMEDAMVAAKEQAKRQEAIIRDHRSFIEGLGDGGKDDLSDYLNDGASKLWP